MIERRINRCENIMDHMVPQQTCWKQKLKTAKTNRRSIPSEALLAAASVCYHGPLSNLARAQLVNDWLQRCRSGAFDVCHDQKVAPSGGINRRVSRKLSLRVLLFPSCGSPELYRISFFHFVLSFYFKTNLSVSLLRESFVLHHPLTLVF